MIDVKKVTSLTLAEMAIANDLQKLAIKAKEMADLIQKVYKCFGIREKNIRVWTDKENDNDHWLSHAGVWCTKCKGELHSVTCDSEDIFVYLKAEYMVENKYVDKDYPDYALYLKQCRTLGHFRMFLEITAKKAETKNRINQ